MSFTTESEGGEYKHKLSLSEIPNKTGSMVFHGAGANGTVLQSVSGAFSSGGNCSSYRNATLTSGASSVGTVNFSLGGGGGSHNNIQPYITVYFWRRTA